MELTEMGIRKAQEAIAIVSDQHLIYFWGQCAESRPVGMVFMLLLDSQMHFFFLKKELLIIYNGLFSAGRLQSKLPCLL